MQINSFKNTEYSQTQIIFFTSLENGNLYLKYICSFPLTKGSLHRVDSNIPLLHYSSLSPSKNGSVLFDPEEGPPPTKMIQSQLPEKTIAFALLDNFISLTQLDGMFTRTDWMRMDLAIPWREKTRSATARNVSGNVFSSASSWRDIPPIFPWRKKWSNSTSFSCSSNQTPPAATLTHFLIQARECHKILFGRTEQNIVWANKSHHPHSSWL